MVPVLLYPTIFYSPPVLIRVLRLWPIFGLVGERNVLCQFPDEAHRGDIVTG